tara:strand:- start:362 stop:748 length:387 start_codon:yes stop_codon:yes gene_type:complete
MRFYYLAIAKAADSDLDWPSKVRYIAISHTVKNKSGHFGIRALTNGLDTLKMHGALDTLEEALLRASVEWKIPVTSWFLYQPPQNIPLYSSPRVVEDKVNYKARKKMLGYLEYYRNCDSRYSPSSYIS